jgi:hypothetical protein
MRHGAGNSIVASGWLGIRGTKFTRSLFFRRGSNKLRAVLIMGLRIFDGVIFEISRVLESFFDLLEYQEAKRASVEKQKQEARSQPEQISDPLQYLYPTQMTK